MTPTIAVLLGDASGVGPEMAVKLMARSQNREAAHLLLDGVGLPVVRAIKAKDNRIAFMASPFKWTQRPSRWASSLSCSFSSWVITCAPPRS